MLKCSLAQACHLCNTTISSSSRHEGLLMYSICHVNVIRHVYCRIVIMVQGWQKSKGLFSRSYFCPHYIYCDISHQN